MRLTAAKIVVFFEGYNSKGSLVYKGVKTFDCAIEDIPDDILLATAKVVSSTTTNTIMTSIVVSEYKEVK